MGGCVLGRSVAGVVGVLGVLAVLRDLLSDLSCRQSLSHAALPAIGLELARQTQHRRAPIGSGSAAQELGQRLVIERIEAVLVYGHGKLPSGCVGGP
jgi:hypothetical protein